MSNMITRILMTLSIMAFLWCGTYLVISSIWEVRYDIINWITMHKAVTVLIMAPLVFITSMIVYKD